MAGRLFLGRGTPFWGRFFSKVVTVPMFLASLMPMLLWLPATSSGLRQLHDRLDAFLSIPDGLSRPGFMEKAPHRQRRLVEQRHQEKAPAAAEDTHEPQPCGTPGPRRPGDHARDIGPRALRDRLFRRPTDAQQPQSGDSDSPPQARGPLGV